jgi:hypothetical protein
MSLNLSEKYPLSNDSKETILYIVAAVVIIAAVIIFFAVHNIVSGTFPLGLCSECH